MTPAVTLPSCRAAERLSKHSWEEVSPFPVDLSVLPIFYIACSGTFLKTNGIISLPRSCLDQALLGAAPAISAASSFPCLSLSPA